MTDHARSHHVPPARPACWTQDASPRWWRQVFRGDSLVGYGTTDDARSCKAWFAREGETADQMRVRINGDVCTGCQRWEDR